MEWPEAKLARLVKVLGAISQDGLSISGVPIAEITRRVSTPCYVYSGEAIIAQIQRVASALGPETSLYYSLKANPSLGVCQLIARQGVGAEVASIGELLLAQRAGFPASRTLFAGPGKTDAELGAAISLGIQAINVESLGEIERLADIASAAGKRAALGLRVNPLKHVKGAYMRMGGGPQQFGIDEEQIPEAIRLAKKSAWLHVVGIHVYGGTQIFDVDGLLAHCAHVVETASDVATQVGQPLEFIDFGGGLVSPTSRTYQNWTWTHLPKGTEAWCSHVGNTRCWSALGPSLNSGDIWWRKPGSMPRAWWTSSTRVARRLS